jgi:hypothetical protein
MLTEKEAREKWCPMVRYSSGTGDDAANRFGVTSPAVCRCIASDCMMWRWDEENIPFGDDNAVGYCGRAGKP